MYFIPRSHVHTKTHTHTHTYTHTHTHKISSCICQYTDTKQQRKASQRNTHTHKTPLHTCVLTLLQHICVRCPASRATPKCVSTLTRTITDLLHVLPSLTHPFAVFLSRCSRNSKVTYNTSHITHHTSHITPHTHTDT